MTIQKAFRKSLQLTFRFDKWHVFPLKERPYAIDVIDFCNVQSNKVHFAEIGCGLGDIIFRVNYRHRTGFDNERRVLRAARFLSLLSWRNRNVKFAFFQFPETTLEGNFDILTLVNWIHHIEPLILQKKIAEYLDRNVTSGGHIIIDTVQDSSYRYNHHIHSLTKGLNCSIRKIGSYAREREVWAIKKIN